MANPRKGPRPGTASKGPAGRVKITKKSPASRGEGRGMDAGYEPAQYYIEKNGKRVGAIFGKEIRRGSAPSWQVFEYEIDPKSGEVTGLKGLQRFTTFSVFRRGIYEGSPFKRAKEFAVEHFGNG